MQNSDKELPANTQQQSAFSKLTGGKLWRTVAPFALASLTGCVTAPQYPPPPQPQTPSDVARAEFFRALNQELQKDEKTHGTILVMDTTGYSSTRAILQHATKQLQQLTSARSYGPHAYGNQFPPLYKITNHIKRLAEFEESTLQGASLTEFAAKGVYPPSLFNTLFAPKAMATTDSTNNPKYVCLAVSASADISLSKLTNDRFEAISTTKTPLAPAFQKALDISDIGGKGSTLHEVGHCINGLKQQKGETHLAFTRRSEGAADAFQMLYRIKSGEPDMLTTLEVQTQWRRSNAASSRAYDIGHNSTQALRLITDDLRQNPNFAQTLTGLSISALETKASDYAQRAILMDYPHLADKKLSTKEKLARSAMIDSEINESSRFVSGMFLITGYNQFPDTLTTAGAVRILQHAHAAENYLVVPPQNQLKQGLAQLREKFPAALNEADTIFADELTRYPKLASAATNIVPPPPITAKAALTPHKPNHKAASKPRQKPKQLTHPTH
jgi:hypothetical protein